MMRSRAVLAGSLAIWGTVFGDTTQFEIKTPDGFVAFRAGSSWPVLGMQSQLPVAVAEFRVPNPMEEGSGASTRVTVRVVDPNTEAGRDAVRRVGRSLAGKLPDASRRGAWAVFKQQMDEGGTRYSVWEGTRDVFGLTVVVRLAWPHLAGNGDDYELQMDSLFRQICDSVYGRTGYWKRREEPRGKP